MGTQEILVAHDEHRLVALRVAKVIDRRALFGSYYCRRLMALALPQSEPGLMRSG
jgi:hypothetical protein